MLIAVGIIAIHQSFSRSSNGIRFLATTEEEG
jgi:hypothetical protein